MKKRSKRRLVRFSLVFGNILLLLVVGFFVFNNRSASQAIRQNSIRGAVAGINDTQNPLDQLSSAEIAVQTAQLVRLPEATAVRNQADSENAQLSIVPSDTSIVAKPQIVATDQKSKKNILHYKTVAGDTITSLAAKYGINAQSIKGSNGLSLDKLDAGKDLLIPPQNGIAYTVKQGDTVDSVVNKYQGSKDLFVTVNDAENGSLAVGDVVWIPNGVQPAPTTRYSQTAYSGFAWGGFTPVYGSNGYDYGYCTWYVANKRAASGHPIPGNLGNASTWKVLAQRAGLPTGPTPKPGAVAWVVPHDYYGHVAYVEEVYADGSFRISEMNVAGWARVSSRIVSAGETGSYYFIY
jgi:surface antigen